VPHAPPGRRQNLPARRVRLIGRDQDLPVARRLLMGSEGRLLTLTGTGGSGKTRLALELAAELVPSFEHGVWLVELAGVVDEDLIANAVASVLDIGERPGEPLALTLAEALSAQELLLVVDNCEHVIAGCAQLVENLLEHCSRLRVLATSREALRIMGETSWRVPSLGLPEPGSGTADVVRAPAVQLFVERAQATVPEFALTPRAADTVSQICSRLDGLPLAIELAAARVRTLTVEQVHERLDDSIRLLVGGSRMAPTRQQTLRATLDWSYDLLSADERIVFRRLSVFVESCSLDAAEAVCSTTDIARDDVLNLVQRLVDQSMVIAEKRDGTARYRLLEPVRHYAHGLLVSHGEWEAARRAHALYYVAFGEARMYHTTIGGPQRMAATRELGREYANIRAALACAIETEAAQQGLRLAASLLYLWQVQGTVSEGLAWLGGLFALPGADEPGAPRGWALLAGAWLAQWSGDFGSALAACQESVRIAHHIDDPLLEWLAQLFWAVNGQVSGDVVSAGEHGRQALAAIRKAKAVADDAMILAGEASTLAQMAHVACDQADYATGRRLAGDGVLRRVPRKTPGAWVGRSPPLEDPPWALASSSVRGAHWRKAC
jgi:predicted ATPase